MREIKNLETIAAIHDMMEGASYSPATTKILRDHIDALVAMLPVEGFVITSEPRKPKQTLSSVVKDIKKEIGL